MSAAVLSDGRPTGADVTTLEFVAQEALPRRSECGDDRVVCLWWSSVTQINHVVALKVLFDGSSNGGQVDVRLQGMSDEFAHGVPMLPTDDQSMLRRREHF